MAYNMASPMEVALQHNSTEAVNLLIKGGASVECESYENLHILAFAMH